MINAQCSMFNPQDLTIFKKKSLPFGKPFTISLHKYHRLTVEGKYDGDVYVLFVSFARQK
jgi:hypothetical protein